MIIQRQNREENEYARGYKDGYRDALKKSLREGVKESPENAQEMLDYYEKAKEELDTKEFSKAGDRDRVPEEIIKKVKSGEGVIHKYKGSWRIVSMKTNPPTFWDAHYETREKAEAGLRAWAANK